MNRNSFANNDGQATSCVQCGKLIPDGNWFARFREDGRWVAVCRPFCLEKYLDAKEAEGETESRLTAWPDSNKTLAEHA
jgi:hypothetical protein